MGFTNFFRRYEKFWGICLCAFKVHIIHVGNMANKGTQGLLKSDVFVIKDILKRNVVISVSTVDIDGVRRLKLPLYAILTPMVDIPYEKADAYAKKLGYMRTDLKYKVLAASGLVIMLFQAMLSAFSAVAVKIGFKAFFRHEVLNRLKDCDLVVSCSDENFKESASLFSPNLFWILAWWSMLFSRTWDVLIAKFLGKKVVLFPNSIGPFRTFIGRFLAKLALNNCDYVLVREPISFEIVNSLRIRSKKILTSDTSLLLPLVNSEVSDLPKPVVGVCLGIYSNILSEKEISRHILAYAKAIDKAIGKYDFSVVFLPHYISGFRYDDFEISQLIICKLKNKNTVKCVNVHTVDEFKSLLGQMDMVISSKMHPAIYATSQYVPTLCIAYDQKQIGYFNRLGLDECVISVREISYEKVLLKIGYVWNKREAIRSSLKRSIPSLETDVREAIKLVLDRSIGMR
jgi:polysaccharide pyruvyl transferase WcaK-like protein